MLKEITIRNFRSFNEEVTFSMEADSERVSEFKNHLVDICDNKLLKVSSIYGPNGGGKTNLIKALELSRRVLLMDYIPSVDPDEFKCVFSNSNEIEETLFFVTKKYEIGLNFSITSDVREIEYIANNLNNINFKNNLKIVKETVVYRKKGETEFSILYERDKKGAIKSTAFEEMDIKSLNLAKSKMVLGKIYDEYANNDYSKYEYLDVIKELYNQIFLIIPLDKNERTVRSTFNRYAQKIENNKFKLIKQLNDVDIKISNINIYNDRPDFIYFEREIELDGKKITKEIPLSDESLGTQKIFKIFLRLLFPSQEDIIFYCDDMNSFLHPKLFRAIIEYFNSDKNNKCQLIFNSHDITNMTNELFRRDEIWFAYRDENYSTKLTSLSNIVNYKGEQVRKDAKYYKQYLEGRYGADPFIKKGLSWYE